MQEPAIEIPREEINNKKCYSCGKVFRTPANLLVHKNRKTPCLIREVEPNQLLNPNRCIFCNRIYSTKGNLLKHSTKCKIKNGGMNILADKVKYEQEIRILKERDIIREEENQRMKERLDEMERKLAQATITQNPQTINNNNNTNNFNAPINITINNYLKPNISYLAVDDLFKNTFKENLVQTPMAIIPLIWFNPEHPENFSIYLVNKSTKETLTYTGNKWDVTTADKVTKDVRDRAYAITNGILNNPNLKVITPYTQNIPAAIAANTTDEELIKAECEKIYNQFMQNRKHRELIKPYIGP